MDTTHPKYSEYKDLVLQRNLLKATMDKFKHMGTMNPNMVQVRARYDLTVKKIKQLFKTHA